jgi:hypothetical protein
MDSPSFECLESLLTCVFRHLETPLLSLDRIADFLSKSDLPSETAISRRALLNVLSHSSQFVRAGLPQVHLFALRPNISFRVSDTAVAAHIEQLLARNGPMTTDQFVASADFPGHDILKKVLEVHADEFSWLPDGRVWFKKTPVPVRAAFSQLQDALEFAFAEYPAGATIEELRRMLCLCVCDEAPITRLAIAKELARKPGFYVQIQRGKYVLIGSEMISQYIGQSVVRERTSSIAGRKVLGLIDDDEEKPFNPESFFGAGFSFATD